MIYVCIYQHILARSIDRADEEDRLQPISPEMINDIYFMWRYSNRPFSIPDWEDRKDLHDCLNTPQYFYSWNLDGSVKRLADKKRLNPDIFALQGLKLQSAAGRNDRPATNSEDSLAWHKLYQRFKEHYHAFLSLAESRTGGQVVFVRNTLP